VAIAEEFRVGGTCVIRGCVPKKFMVMASDFAHQFETAEGYGWTVEASFDWPKFLQAKDVEIARLSGIYAANLGKAGVDLVNGRAVLTDAHTVKVTKRDGTDGGTFTAEKILIATGGRPWVPEGMAGIEHVITSEEAFHLPELPKRILIAGGGYIAVEFAGIFAGSASRRPWSIAGRTSCAASTTTCAPIWPARSRSAASRSSWAASTTASRRRRPAS
jgi:glutathione reductase (NADPH)